MNGAARHDRRMGSDGKLALPAGTVSMLVACPDPPASGGPLGAAVAKAGRAHSALPLAHGPPGSGWHAAVFARASDAAGCALAVQRALTADAVPVRIAVHTSQVGEAGQPGPGLDRCAALAHVAWTGQVLLSQAPTQLVAGGLGAGGLGAGADLADLGWHRLADLGPAEHVWQLCHPDLPGAFPPLRSLATYRHNLPIELTSFVPRHAELAELTALIAEARLVTLTGSGGCGKTRLALHAAVGRVGAHADGVWLADLAALRDPARVAATVADVLQVRQRGPGSGPAELAAAIGTQELLLVLDNCEHLIRSCAEVADGLLRGCPRLRILATSREPLGVPGEVTWLVPSLPFPSGPSLVPPGDLVRFEAVRLFAERARLAHPRFALTEDNAAAVAEICARLDGIPLAIELAAARARVFSAAQIAAGLHDRFGLLAGGARTAVPRQQTLEASVAWSYDLLAEPERAVLRQLSVFTGGFTLEAARVVAVGAGQPEEVVAQVSSLADKSLIVGAEEGTGDRFRMLETIRDYAAGRLLEAGEAAEVQARHFGFFARAVDRRPGEDEDSYCERLRADYDNIRVALGWASRQDDSKLLLGLVTRLVVFWSASTHLAEAVQWLRTAIDRGRQADPGLRARALGGLTQMAGLTLDLPLAFAAGTEGLTLLRQLGDKEGVVMTLTSLGFSISGDEGRPYLEEAIALAEEIGDQRALAYALAMRGRVANTVPADRPAGRDALRRGIEVARQCGARHVEGIALGDLGVLSSLDGRPRDAIPLLTEALPLLREAGDVYFLSLTLIGLVQSLSLAGDYDAALAPCRELDSISGQLGAAQLYFAPCARGVAAYSRGDWPEAIRSFREQLTFFSPILMDGMWVGHLAWAEFLAGQAETARRRLDDFIASSEPARISLALPWAVRAVIARASGDHELAAGLAVQAVAASPADPFGQSTVLECLAVMAAVQADDGQHELAVRLAAALAAFADGVGLRQPPSVCELIDPVLRTCRKALGADGFDAAWLQGQDLTLAEAVAYVTRGRGPRSRPALGWASLTPTELTVTRAVADGLSNPQIAARMFISRRTVTTHLTSIFHKLGISSRAQLAALAARREDQEATRSPSS
jgi:predicted ATPase/DNA-binding CsgD family transcriptional regulator